MKSFINFIREELDDNPNPQSGGLEADRTKKGESGTLKLDPNKRAALLQIARGVLKDRRKGTEGTHHREAIKNLMAAGMDGDEIMQLNAKLERIKRRPVHLGAGEGGERIDLISKAFKETNPTGENLDTKA